MREKVAQAFCPLAKLNDENTVECVFEMSMEDPFDEKVTRDIVCGILMEALVSQYDFDGAVGRGCFIRCYQYHQ